MTDKVQKIREEVERLRNLHQIKYQHLDTNDNMCLVECGKRNLCNELLSFIDSLQEEPVSIWHDASEKPERENLLIETNDGRIIHRQSINNYGMVKKWAYTSDLLNLDNSCNFDKNSQDLVSDDLSAEICHLSKRYPEVSFVKLSRIAAHIAKWQKDNTIRKVAKWLYANFYISKEYVSETSILPIPKYAHNATMVQFISEFIKHMKKG